jgi:hypothetical protein
MPHSVEHIGASRSASDGETELEKRHRDSCQGQIGRISRFRSSSSRAAHIRSQHGTACAAECIAKAQTHCCQRKRIVV